MTEWKYRVGGRAGRAVIDTLLWTVRFEAEGKERLDQFLDRGEPVIFCLWHGRLLPLTYFHRGGRIATLISRSADGEYIARVVQGWGYTPVRGSSSRGGGAALKELVRWARKGWSLALTPDGPRGPRQKLQPGVVTAAQLTGLPIIPLAAGADRAWWPGSWDRFCVPKPFARVRVLYGQPRRVDREASEEERQRHREELEAELNDMIRKVDRHGGPDR